MFGTGVISTPFTDAEGEKYFGSKITGENLVFDDKSLLATLRALIYPRMPEDSRLYTVVSSITKTRAQMSRYDGEDFLSLLGISDDVQDTLKIFNASVGYSADDRNAIFEAAEKFIPSLNNYVKNEALTAFFAKSFRVLCYQNPVNRVCIVFVDTMNLAKFHLIQCTVFSMLPWYFDKEKGITEDERNLMYSLKETNAETYTSCLDKISEMYDLREGYIRESLKGFEARRYVIRKDQLTRDIENLLHSIDNYKNAIASTLAELHEKRISFAGVMAMMNDSEESSEIMDFFLRNKNVKLVSVDSNGYVNLVVHGYLSYFDIDETQRAINNPRSFMYTTKSDDLTNEDVKLLFSEVFKEDESRVKVRFAAGYYFTLTGTFGGRQGDRCGVNNTYLINPHIYHYGCTGDYTSAVFNLIKDGRYSFALEQMVASCYSLAVNDPSFEYFFSDIYSKNHGNYRYKCFELPDGRCVNVKEAVEWLKSQNN